MMHYKCVLGILLVVLGSFSINVVQSDQLSIIVRQCPQECICYRGLTTVKCRETSLNDLPRIAKDLATQIEVL
jgi:hypothetical protein